MSSPKSTFAAALVCAAGLAAIAVTTPASAMPLTHALALKSAAPAGAVETVHWRGRGWGGRGWGWGGFAAGAVIGGALAAPYYYGPRYYPAPYPPEAYEEAPVSGDAIAYCQQRFRSYDPSTGTYLGFDGARHPCP
jgi:hypothetical protein